MAQSLVIELEDNGYIVESSDPFRIAKELKEREVPDLIILDLIVPAAIGAYEIIRKQLNLRVPILFLMLVTDHTVEKEIATLETSFGLDDFDFLEKPILPSKALEKVSSMLSSARRRNEQKLILQTPRKLDVLQSATKLKVFLCHSSKDKITVRTYYDRFCAEGWIESWLDEKKLVPGADWELEIRLAVKSSHVVLVFLSKYSVNKEGYVQKEIKQALDVADEKPDGAIFIIPLRLEDCEVPERLKKWHWLNLYENDSYNKLLTSLRIRANDLAEKNIGVL
jgi:CheY-like chemotaxis protein